MIELPDEFKNIIISIYGKTGEKWLAGLDGLIDHCLHKWRLKLLPAKKLSYNFVVPVVFENGSKAILKLGVPGAWIMSEIAALKAFNGIGFCKLLDAEPEKGVMLLENIEPGEPLNILCDDAAATKIVAGLINDMQQANPVSDYPFQTAANWYNNLVNLHEEFDNIVPQYLFTQAIAAYKSLETHLQDQRLLHGDLHQENILSAGTGKWKAIDPKGIIAETACELTPYLMNDLNGKDISVTISDRINVFSEELKIDKIRIIKWGAFRSVLSVYWKAEDNLLITPEDIMICESFYK
ncbi:MAG: kinase [Mucilaginibacter sp.]|nr:kinase [Mucilaginibacter sp.]